MIERLSLNSLKFFYYVARYDSVTIAAEKLFVTQGAVSKQLKNLEEVLGRRLFIRDGKKLQLTGGMASHCLIVVSRSFLRLTNVSYRWQKKRRMRRRA